jgi:hypothetical protein
VVPPAVVGSGRGVMDHESTGLTETERRILAEIEASMVLPRTVTTRHGGLIAGAVWAAAAGYLVVFLALSVLTAGATPARCLARLRRLISLDVEPVRRTS